MQLILLLFLIIVLSGEILQAVMAMSFIIIAVLQL